MLPDPLHPAIVHMPLALAILLPIGVLLALWAIRRFDAKKSLWAVVVGLTFLLVISARVATSTGEAQEDVVEEVVTHDAIEDHEEAGEAFFLTAAVVFAISLFGLANGRIGDVMRPLTLAATVALVVAAFQVGGSGGRLVYEHGAASAYAGAPTLPAVVAELDRDDDDDH